MRSDRSFQQCVDKGTAKGNGFGERKKALFVLALRVLTQPRIEPNRGIVELGCRRIIPLRDDGLCPNEEWNARARCPIA